ncbi:MAG: transaldolase family protein [Candidatus Limnocylindrales bacterium]
MSESYFERVKQLTPTRLWINNPTLEEIELAQTQGAVGCTTNPSYAGGLLKRVPAEVQPIIASLTGQSDDDQVVAELAQRRLVARVAESFLPRFHESGGHEGFVSIQGSPGRDTDWQDILAEAEVARTIAANVTPKIPATLPGFKAFEDAVRRGWPTIITEVFSLAQLSFACEAYVRITDQSRSRPPFFVSPITGILGDHLKRLAADRGIDSNPRLLERAGVILARACNSLVEERAYPVTLLFGGARTMEDFTGLVGAPTAATINYSTVHAILAADPDVSDTIHLPIDEGDVAELRTNFADFRAALMPDGLRVDEFEDFGPVQHFRSNFVAGWDAVTAAIASARAVTA